MPARGKWFAPQLGPALEVATRTQAVTWLRSLLSGSRKELVVGEDLFDDFQRGLVFVDVAVRARAQSVEPRTDSQPIACKTPIAAERGTAHHVAMPCTSVAIGQHQPQRDFLGCQLGGVDVGGWAQAIDVQHERRGHRLFGREALDHQIVRGQCCLDGDLAGVLAEQAR